MAMQGLELGLKVWGSGFRVWVFLKIGGPLETRGNVGTIGGCWGSYKGLYSDDLEKWEFCKIGALQGLGFRDREGPSNYTLAYIWFQ